MIKGEVKKENNWCIESRRITVANCAQVDLKKEASVAHCLRSREVTQI